MRTPDYWKCVEEGCQDDKMYNYKGLCRSCTEYDDKGKVVEAVSRVKTTKEGTVIEQTTSPRRAVTLQDFKDFRRQNRRLTHKQVEALKAASSHALTQAQQDMPEDVSDMPIDTDVMPIGESLGEEE
jgi:predicted DNA binding protein